MKGLRLFLVAAFVIVADLGVVVLILGSLWVERRLDMSPGIILDVMTIVAVSYVAIGWSSEKFLEWEFKEDPEPPKNPLRDSSSQSVEPGPDVHRAH